MTPDQSLPPANWDSRADDRVVVVHADDIGMCHTHAACYRRSLMAFGLVTSASAMVPCPWFLEAASWHRRNPSSTSGST